MTKESAVIQRLSDSGIATAEELGLRAAHMGGDLFKLVLELVRDVPQHRKKIGRIWGDHLGLAFVDLATTLMHASAIEAVPEGLARARHVVPLYETGGALTIATSASERAELQKCLEQATGRMVEFVFSFPDDISDAIELAYQSQQAISKLLAQTRISELGKPSEVITAQQLEWMAGQESIVQFARGVMLLAVKEGASDIHIEPGEHNVRIRFRIDGSLLERFSAQAGGSAGIAFESAGRSGHLRAAASAGRPDQTRAFVSHN